MQETADGRNDVTDGLLDGSTSDAEKGQSSSGHPSQADGLQRTVTAQDWQGPDDPENPYNWPFWQRAYHTTIPSLYLFAITFGSSVYTPGYPEVMERFDVSSTIGLLGVSLYVLGLAFGPVLAAPISETRGRRVVDRVSLPLAAFFKLGAGFSQNMWSLAITRFFAGFFGSPTLAVGTGTNVDVWPPVHRAIASSLFLLAPFLGPTLGPALGGFMAQHKGRRWTQWLTLFVMIPTFIYALGMKETYKKIILQHRAKKLGIPQPPKGPTGIAALKFLFTVTLIRPMKVLHTDPIVTFLASTQASVFSVLFGFLDAFPIVFGSVYRFDTGLPGLRFLCIGLGVCLGSIGVPISLFWFAWTARKDIHWISPVLATVPFAWGNLPIFTAAALYLVDVYGPMNGASALAANGLVRYIAGAAFPLFTMQISSASSLFIAANPMGAISIWASDQAEEPLQDNQSVEKE